MTSDSLIEDQSQFVNPAAIKHPARTTIQHWQLRDLLSCDANDKAAHFFYVNQNTVNKYNTKSKESQSVLDLDFSPTSMTVGCGFVAAGGQLSQLYVKDLSDNTIKFQSTVGGSVNNALSVTRHGGDIRLLCSNNDDTVKVFSLPTMTPVTTIPCGVAINYAAVSPDGTRLVTVGDSNNAFLYDIRHRYQKIATFTAETSDAGMSAAWNCTGDKFAVASQDGSVCVWDVRSHRVLARLHAKQNQAMSGACRAVKFSPSGLIDLLVFSEHVSYVHVVDTRTFKHEQVVRVAPPHHDHHISGICFSPDSTRFFVGLEDYVAEYSVDTVCRRSFEEGTLI